ncbi:MAG TPA: hypothetical protein VG797_09860 [Phycisphaerales bacterium]|nr:hypothetical protein [Phycisphaerales bacterium]
MPEHRGTARGSQPGHSASDYDVAFRRVLFPDRNRIVEQEQKVDRPELLAEERDISLE